MPINSGTFATNAIRFGTVPIVRVYNGSILLYDANASATVTPAAVRSVTVASIAYNNTSKTIARPAGTTNGDLMLLIMHADYGATSGFKVPAGFTTLATRELAANGDKQVIGYKIASGEPSSYTITVPVDADVRADMFAITGADLNQAPIVTTATLASSTSTHPAPSVSPTSGRNLLLSTVSKSAGSGGQTFSWTPPSGMTERSDAATNGYVTQTTATQTYDSSQPTGTRTFNLTSSAAASAAIGASILIASGVVGGSAPPPDPVAPAGYSAVGSNGSGGSWTDGIATNRTFQNTAGTNSEYRWWGSHVPTGNRTTPIPLVIHFHGDGAYEYDNPTTWTSPQYMQVAKDIGGIGVIPNTPDKAGSRTWWEDSTSRQWAIDLIREMCRLYNIDKRQIYLSGFSGGSVLIGAYIMKQWHADLLGGGAMLLGGGQAGSTTRVGTYSSQLLADFPMRWHVGVNDTASNAPDGYDGKLAAEGGEAYYRGQGFNTGLTYLANQNHAQSEDKGPAALRALVNISRTRYGLSTI
jgi:predicted esterase